MVSAKKSAMPPMSVIPSHITAATPRFETTATACVTISRVRRSKRSASAPPNRPKPSIPRPRIVPIAPTRRTTTPPSAKLWIQKIAVTNCSGITP